MAHLVTGYAPTFHSVYISTARLDQFATVQPISTFHSVYISTYNVRLHYIRETTLHSTLFILVLLGGEPQPLILLLYIPLCLY